MYNHILFDLSEIQISLRLQTFKNFIQYIFCGQDQLLKNVVLLVKICGKIYNFKATYYEVEKRRDRTNSTSFIIAS